LPAWREAIQDAAVVRGGGLDHWSRWGGCAGTCCASLIRVKRTGARRERLPNVASRWYPGVGSAGWYPWAGAGGL